MEDKIKELEKQQEEIAKQIESLKEELKNNTEVKKWMPKEDEIYYMLSYDRTPMKLWYLNEDDEREIKCQRIFKTEEEAQRYANYLNARDEYSYDFSNEEWKNKKVDKVCIFYDVDVENLGTTYASYKYLNEIYFKTQEKAQEFIDKYRKDILEFEFGIKE